MNRPATAVACLLTIICFALGQALQSSDGRLEPGAFRWLLVALLAGAVTLWGARRIAPEVFATIQGFLVIVAVLWEVVQQFFRSPGANVSGSLVPFFAGIVVMAVTFLVGQVSGDRQQRATPFIVSGVFLLLGVWLFHVSPAPDIDVFVFQTESADALMHGQNPYALRFRDIYSGRAQYDARALYGDGLSVNGVLQFGFPYLPWSLLLTTPSQLVFGDYRYTQLFAVVFTAGVAMWLRPGRNAVLAGALLLFSPRVFFVLEQGWTEPLVVALLAAVVLTHEKRPSLTPWVFGLLLAAKQYTVFMLPLAWLLLTDEQRNVKGALIFLAKAAVPAVLVTLPFVLWNPGEFWFSVVELQTLQPFRDDSLSVMAKLARVTGHAPASWWAFVAATAVLGLSLWRLPRGSAGFLIAVTVTYLAFFATSKQAFANYYFLVIGAAALAVAALGRGTWRWRGV
ncbi:MAG: hypothetical protein DI536_19980 [Archangium gephyra]|uniref:DUF2029 domain-containing protein n=1 Tax=Archangium gephyra TaxID=48 RepID=A0A2W5TBM8_9BACT|nr:MAG: hypothetical protein DI536_19980 [Archangium gephyra]